jgi:hypothetical protein
MHDFASFPAQQEAALSPPRQVAAFSPAQHDMAVSSLAFSSLPAILWRAHDSPSLASEVLWQHEAFACGAAFSCGATEGVL